MSRKSTRTAPARTMRKRRSGPIEPIVIDTSVEVKKAPPIHIFTIDDVDYFMDAEPSPALALRMLEMAELNGEAAAMSYVLAEVLGPEGHTALKNCDSLTKAQLEAILEIVGDHVMGALDDEGK